MKNQKEKKLVLSKDTLRKLTNDKLSLARGGAADLSALICMTLSCRTCGGTDCGQAL